MLRVIARLPHHSMLNLPVRKTVWGPVNTFEDLRKAIMKSGQPFGVDWSGPACEVNPSFSCDKTYYQYLGFGLHSGIDIPVSTGTEIFAVADGKCVEISDVPTRGLGVVLFHPALKLKTVYWHNKENKVIVGQEVKVGELIAISDNSGYSKGPHLHFEVKITDEHGVSIKPVDPFLYFTGKDMLLTKEQVEKIYALWGLNDPEGVVFWENKELDELLDARLKDELAQLKQFEL